MDDNEIETCDKCFLDFETVKNLHVKLGNPNLSEEARRTLQRQRNEIQARLDAHRAVYHRTQK